MHRVENSRILFLDEKPIRRLLEFRSEFYPVMLRVLDVVYARGIQMVASPISLANVSRRAYERGAAVLAREYREFFTKSSQFMLREVDADVALVSARFRAERRLSLEDSLQMATAYVCGADLVLSESASLKDLGEMNIVLLSELA